MSKKRQATLSSFFMPQSKPKRQGLLDSEWLETFRIADIVHPIVIASGSKTQRSERSALDQFMGTAESNDQQVPSTEPVTEERQAEPPASNTPVRSLEQRFAFNRDDASPYDPDASTRHEEFVAKFLQPRDKRRKAEPLSPLERQVTALKEKHPGILLVIEVGYKFRFFGEDAKVASRVLHIANYVDRNFWVASIPTHRLAVHVRRLVHAGYKVGVVRQTETAVLKSTGDNKAGPFTRELKHLYTKSTFVDEMTSDLDLEVTKGASSSSGYLLCLVEEKRGGGGHDERVQIGMVAVQPVSGDVVHDSFEDGYMRSELETRLLHIEPGELLLPLNLSKQTEKVVKHMGLQRTSAFGDSVRIERMPQIDPFMSDHNAAFTYVSDFYSQRAEGGPQVAFSEILKLQPTVIKALAATIRYLSEFGIQHALNLTKYFVHFSSQSHMLLNGNTLANLEIYRNSTDCSVKGSLFAVLDHTQTAFGKRLLRKWVGRPLIDVTKLNQRIDAVDELLSTDNPKAASAKALLKKLPDLEKGLSRIHYGQASPTELVQVLDALLKIAETFHGSGGAEFQSSLLNDIFSQLPLIRPDVLELKQVLNPDAVVTPARKLDLLKPDDRWPELDQEKENIAGIEKELESYLAEQQAATKIPSLRFLSVAGIEYLLEVRNTAMKMVPKEWIKINGTKAASRFHSPWLISKLKERERHHELLVAAFDQAYRTFLRQVIEKYEVFRDVILGLGQLDCLFSLATVAQQANYVKPRFSEHAQLRVTNGRHPMVEQLLDNYVANDVDFDDTKRTMVLTGPNMGGKSSYMRQVALIAIMGQIGSYVPADRAELGILDAVYTRMGALDNMLAGESTFMVELHEASDIMRAATPRSLVILDELGRGTATMDGMAIAYAVLRHFITEIRSITLFVTHYPFLAELADEFADCTVNGHMSFIQDSDGEIPHIIFLYKLVQGVSTRSYGINVARLAELPRSVLDSAKLKAAEMETNVQAKAVQHVLRRALADPKTHLAELRRYLCDV